MNEFSPSFNAPAVQNYGTWNGLPVTYANGTYSAGDYTLTPQKGGAGYNISGYTGSTAPVGTGAPGQIWAPPSPGNNWVGQWTTPSTSGGGGLLGAVSDLISNAGSSIASSPIAQAVITAIAASAGVPPNVTAGLLAANSTGQAGNLGAGVQSGLMSYGVGSGMNALTGAAAPATSIAGDAIFPGALGGGTIPAVTGDAIFPGALGSGNGLLAGAGAGAAAATAASLAPAAETAASTGAASAPSTLTVAGDATLPGALGPTSMGGNGLLGDTAAATTAATTGGGPIGSEAGAAYNPVGVGSGAIAGGTAVADTTLADVLTGAKAYAPLIGAVAGALGSGSSSTSQTATKDPWAPAQAWMKSNLGLGQQLQAQYAANPFSQFQQQAYNNSAGLGNSFRGGVNSLVSQMNNFKPYQRTPQSQVASTYKFASPNLGLTSMPFGGSASPYPQQPQPYSGA